LALGILKFVKNAHFSLFLSEDKPWRLCEKPSEGMQFSRKGAKAQRFILGKIKHLPIFKISLQSERNGSQNEGREKGLEDERFSSSFWLLTFDI
jgi:hypothetical protein